VRAHLYGAVRTCFSDFKEEWKMAIIAVGIAVAFLVLILMNVGGFISQILGQLLYHIAVPMMWLCDFVQVLFRKLAGLGTTFVKETGGAIKEQNEDILFSLLTSKTVLEVFVAMCIVGVILLLITTIIQIIRTEYTTEGSKNSKTTIIGTALKAFAYFFITPVACVFGIIISNYVLKAVDAATSGKGASTIAGSVFVAAANDANRVRKGDSTGWYENLMSGQVSKWTVSFNANNSRFDATFDERNFGVTNTGNAVLNRENAADKIDRAFSQGSLLSTLAGGDGGPKMTIGDDYHGIVWSTYWVNPYFSYDQPSFVSRYYNLANVNYLILYVGLAICIVTLFKAAIGMIMRMYKATMLFIISPGVIGIWPLDGGNAFNSWRKQFVGTVLAAYGTIIALNLYFVIVGVIDHIYLFHPQLGLNGNISSLEGNATAVLSSSATMTALLYPLVTVVNAMVRALMIIVGALMISEFASTVSSLIGADDALKQGGDMGGKVAGAVGKGAMVAMGGAALAMKAGKGIASGVKAVGNIGFTGKDGNRHTLGGAIKAGSTGWTDKDGKMHGGLFKKVEIGADGKQKLVDRKGVAGIKTGVGFIGKGLKKAHTGLSIADEAVGNVFGSQAAIDRAAARRATATRDKKLAAAKKAHDSGMIDDAKYAKYQKLANDEYNNNTAVQNVQARHESRRAKMHAVGAMFGSSTSLLKNTNLFKNLDTATMGMIPAFGQGKGLEALKKEAASNPVSKVYMDAVDSEKAANKSAKSEAAVKKAEDNVQGMNNRAAAAALVPAIKTGLQGANLDLTEKSMNELANKIARTMATNGGKFDDSSLASAIAEGLRGVSSTTGSPIDGKAVATDVANAVKSAITSSQMSDAKKSGDVAGMLQMLASKDKASNDALIAAVTKLTDKIDKLGK